MFAISYLIVRDFRILKLLFCLLSFWFIFFVIPGLLVPSNGWEPGIQNLMLRILFLKITF